MSIETDRRFSLTWRQKHSLVKFSQLMEMTIKIQEPLIVVIGDLYSNKRTKQHCYRHELQSRDLYCCTTAALYCTTAAHHFNRIIGREAEDTSREAGDTGIKHPTNSTLSALAKQLN